MKQWYVVEVTASGHQTHGPLDLDGVRRLLDQGRVSLQSQACEVGALEWKSVRDISELHVLIEPQAAASSPQALPPYSIGTALELGFSSLKSNYAMLLLVALIFIAAQGVLQLLSLPLSLMAEQLDPGGSPLDADPVYLLSLLGLVLVLTFAGIVIGIPVAAGIQWTGVRALRNKLQISDFFEPFRRFFAVLGVTAITGLIAFTVFIPAVIVLVLTIPRFDDGALRPVESVGSLLPAILVFVVSACVMLYLSIRLYFAPVLVIDDEVTDAQGQRLGVWAALRRSWQMTSGHMLSLLVYGFLATLIIFSTLLLFCVGIFFVGLPLAMTFYGAAYETLRRSP
jgi:hypothetical protein